MPGLFSCDHLERPTSMSEVREALTAAGASALVPKIISRALLEYQRRYAPVIAAIPSIKWDTDVYFFNRRDANPNGGAVTDGGARPMTNSTYNQVGFQMKHTQIIGGVTGYAQAVTSGQIGDLLGKEVDGALKGMYWDLETYTMWGNAAATLNGAYPLFDGFDSMVSTFSGTGQNCLDWKGAALTLGALDQLADMVENNAAMSVFNSSWMYVLSNTAYSKMSQLLQAQQRFNDRVEVAAGLLVPTYRDIPLVKSSFLATRTYSMGTVTQTTATTGGALPATTAYKYKVTAVIQRQAETLPSAEVTSTTGSGSTNIITLSFTPPTGLDGLSPVLYKVYRTAGGGAADTETLLGVVDATVGIGADGVSPIPTTSIIDTGVTLIPQNGSTQPAVPTAAYAGTNANKFVPQQTTLTTPTGTAPLEPIYLVPRDEDFLCRPYVREAERLNVATTVTAPDTLPFAMQTDTVVALRAPKYMGCLTRVNSALT